jgi:hypothetical protein
MSKLTSAIDAKSLVIGVLLTVVVFMSMGAHQMVESVRVRHTGLDTKSVTGIPFAVYGDRIWYYE